MFLPHLLHRADETQEFWGNDVRGGDGLNNIERVCD